SKALSLVELYRAKPLRLHPYIQKKQFTLAESHNVFIYNQTPFSSEEIKFILKTHFPDFLRRGSNINKLLEYQRDHIEFRGNNLIIFGQTIHNQICMYQLIFNKKNKLGKDKHFPKNIIKHKTYHAIGMPFHKNL
ncbi:hypothetical protein, partial [Bacillus cereus]|uniref:hypothetical protein n=1 Tax=Bacillus cereus TaxID=1396 RepID=UPI0034D71DAF